MSGRETKKNQVKALSEKFSKSRGTFLVSCMGLNVERMTDLRKSLKMKQADITVIRNTLARLALEGEEHSELKEACMPHLTGPNAFVLSFGESALSVAKTLCDFGEENEVFQIKGGLLDGIALSVQAVMDLSKLPSRDELRACLLGTLSAPLVKFLGTFQAVPAGMAGVLNSYKQKKEEKNV